MAHTEVASVIAPLEDRPVKNTICLFDVDNTLSLPRLVWTAPSQLTSSAFSIVKPQLIKTHHLAACNPRNARSAFRPSAQMRHRLRWRLQLRQTTRAARDPFHRSHVSVRLLLRGEWVDGDSAGSTAGLEQLHPVVRGGQVQEAGQLVSEIHCRS